MQTPPTRRQSSRLRGILAIASVYITLLVIVVLILHGGLPLFARNAQTAAPSPRPTTTAAPAPLRLTLYDHLNSIDMRSSSEGWIVGSSGQDGQTLVLHLSHGVWITDSLQLPPMNPTVIKMVSDNEGWIAGSDTNGYGGHGVMFHIIGGQAEPVALPDGVGEIESLAMVSPTEGWAVDSTSASGRSQILHYSAGAWTVALITPDNMQLMSISMVSPSEGWAAGVGAATGALWHYAAGAWRQIPLHDSQQASLDHISMLSPSEGWGIGGFALPHQPSDQYVRTGGVIWRYSDGAWRVVERIVGDPAQSQTTQLSAIQAVAPGEVWVSLSDGIDKHFLHGVNGTWQKAPAAIRDGITSLSMVAPDRGWAVGNAGQIMQCRDNVWFDYPTL